MHYQDIIYKNYLSLGFKDLNTADFEKISKSYELNYDDLITCRPEAKILDIGCGMGHFLYYLKKRGFKNFLGLEIGREQVDYCLKNVTDNVELVEDVSGFLEGHRNYFDLAVINDVLEHFNKEKQIELLSKILGSLNEGGRIIIRTMNMGHLFSSSFVHIDFTHETGFSEISLPAVLKAVGFKEAACRPEKIYIRSRLKRVIFNLSRKAYIGILKVIILLERPGDNYPKIFSKNLISWAEK